MIKSEFNEKKKLLQLQKDLEEFKHNSKMKELEYMRVNNTLFHEREMERQRIKSAEIRKNQERKQNFEFARNYPIK